MKHLLKFSLWCCTEDTFIETVVLFCSVYCGIPSQIHFKINSKQLYYLLIFIHLSKHMRTKKEKAFKIANLHSEIFCCIVQTRDNIRTIIIIIIIILVENAWLSSWIDATNSIEMQLILSLVHAQLKKPTLIGMWFEDASNRKCLEIFSISLCPLAHWIPSAVAGQCHNPSNTERNKTI